MFPSLHNVSSHSQETTVLRWFFVCLFVDEVWSAVAHLHSFQSLPPGSKDSPASASQVAGTIDAHHQAQLIFVFLVEMGFYHIGQAGLELLTSGDPPAFASQSAGITGRSNCAPPTHPFSS